jgi:NDP-sugar pyrophosphorylase family protein
MSVGGKAYLSIRALVLTAGFGTRLEPLTYLRAKAAVPVNGETLARRVIRWLVAQGVREQVLNLHHLPATITASVGDGSDLGASIRYSWENPVLGSAGGPRHALPLLVDQRDDDPFLLVNGDTLTDLDLAAMLSTHVSSGATVTIAVIPNPRPDKYGGVVVSDGGWVTGFTRAASGQPSHHFIGVQAVQRAAFESLPDGVPAETVAGIYPRLIASEAHSVAAFSADATFRDIGTPADYLDTSIQIAASEGDRLVSGRHVEIHSSASVVRTAIWDDVKIGAGADLLDCIVCDGAVIPAGARYRRCAILPAAGREPKGTARVEGDLLVASF